MNTVIGIIAGVIVLYVCRKIDDFEFRLKSCEIYIDDLEKRIFEIENLNNEY